MLKGLKSLSTKDLIVFSVNFMKNELGKTKNDEKCISLVVAMSTELCCQE